MSDYHHLHDMGILNPEQIERYMVNGVTTYDVLKIIYLRKKGSLLPQSRTYKFPRVQTYIMEGDGKRKTVVMESNPGLVAAVDELKSLINIKQEKQDLKASLIEQIGLLEEELELRTQCIKDLAKQL